MWGIKSFGYTPTVCMCLAWEEEAAFWDWDSSCRWPVVQTHLAPEIFITGIVSQSFSARRQSGTITNCKQTKPFSFGWRSHLFADTECKRWYSTQVFSCFFTMHKAMVIHLAFLIYYDIVLPSLRMRGAPLANRLGRQEILMLEEPALPLWHKWGS